MRKVQQMRQTMRIGATKRQVTFPIQFLAPSPLLTVNSGCHASLLSLQPHIYTSSRSTAFHTTLPYTHRPFACQCNIPKRLPTTALIKVGQVTVLWPISFSHLQPSPPIPLLLHHLVRPRNPQVLLLRPAPTPTPRLHRAQHSPSRRQRSAPPPKPNHRPRTSLLVRESLSFDTSERTNDMGGT